SSPICPRPPTSALFPYTTLFRSPISPDSVRLRIAISREDEVDAWGELEIPTGTYNVLREKRTEIRSSAVEAKIIGLGGWFDITQDRKSTRLNSSHVKISYAVFCL